MSAFAAGARGWSGPVAATVVGGYLRLSDLGTPHAVVFDETYYVKDALSLLRFGYERGTVKGADDLLLAGNGDWRSLDIFTGDPAFVVHPPFGKWVIAAGEYALGATPAGWRIAVALLGTLSILLLGRIVRRLTGNDLVGTLAAFILALEGLHLVMSRTAVLDGVLAFTVLAAFGAVVLDRDWARHRYGERLARGVPAAGVPASWWRPWRIVAAIMLGLSCSVKWSGLWFVAAFGLLTVALEVGNRRTIGVRRPVRSALLGDALPALVTIVGLGALTYLATWTGWFLSADAWKRTYVAGGGPWPSLLSLVEYHREAFTFHVGVGSEHPYRAPAWGWPLQARPTSFYYERTTAAQGCPVADCSSAVTALGNPVVWWAGLLALFHQMFRWVLGLDWRAGAVLTGFLAGWVPWLLFPDRTIFTFYAVVLSPFLAAALAMSLGRMLGSPADPPQRRAVGIVAVSGVLMAIVLAAWWLLPIWNGQLIPHDAWRLRMWWPTWI